MYNKGTTQLPQAKNDKKTIRVIHRYGSQSVALSLQGGNGELLL